MTAFQINCPPNLHYCSISTKTLSVCSLFCPGVLISIFRVYSHRLSTGGEHTKQPAAGFSGYSLSCEEPQARTLRLPPQYCHWKPPERLGSAPNAGAEATPTSSLANPVALDVVPDHPAAATWARDPSQTGSLPQHRYPAALQVCGASFEPHQPAQRPSKPWLLAPGECAVLSVCFHLPDRPP